MWLIHASLVTHTFLSCGLFQSRFVNELVEFANIQYLLVAYTDSEVIEIRVCRDNGRTVYFNGGKVNLHFRQVRN